MVKCRLTINADSFRREPDGSERRQPFDLCGVFTPGQAFILDSPEHIPVGFCPLAWNEIQDLLAVFFANGHKGGDVVLACCPPGTRPVTLWIEKVEEEGRE